MRKIPEYLTTDGKGTKNKKSTRGKMFGYQVLGFGAGGAAAKFIEATGGTTSTSGDFKIHTFTSPGTFEVTQIADETANNEVSYVVVAGGGGSGNFGGGGAGGYREYKSSVDSYTASPLDGSPGGAGSGTPISVTAQSYPITVGSGGGPAGRASRNPGNPSVFSSITSTAGGGGGTYRGTYNSGGNQSGDPGGSGGGMGATDQGGSGSVGSGNTPPVTPSQGNPGGPSPGGTNQASGGGGGAASAGAGNSVAGSGIGTAINPAAGVPGPDGALKYFAGGAAGGGISGGGNTTGGIGGGGNYGTPPTSGTDGTGGGAGSGTGGSGVVIIRYKVA